MPDKREEFIKELRALCIKHGLYIVHWNGTSNLAPIDANGEDVLGSFESFLEELKDSGDVKENGRYRNEAWRANA